MPYSVVNTGNALNTFETSLVSISETLGTANYCISNGVIPISGAYSLKNRNGTLKQLTINQVLSTSAGTFTTAAVRGLIFANNPSLTLVAGDALDLGANGVSPVGTVDFDTWDSLGSHHSQSSAFPDMPHYTDYNETDINILLVTKDANWSIGDNTIKIFGVMQENG